MKTNYATERNALTDTVTRRVSQKFRYIKTNHPTMITTHAIAQEIPPRLHEAKGKAKVKAKPGGKKTAITKSKQFRKRPASDKESDEDASESDPPEHVVKKKRAKRRHMEESEGEVELVETDVEPPDKEVEDVDDDGSGEPPDEQEVSTIHAV
jgi:hypothetical protein